MSLRPPPAMYLRPQRRPPPAPDVPKPSTTPTAEVQAVVEAPEEVLEEDSEETSEEDSSEEAPGEDDLWNADMSQRELYRIAKEAGLEVVIRDSKTKILKKLKSLKTSKR